MKYLFIRRPTETHIGVGQTNYVLGGQPDKYVQHISCAGNTACS